MAAAPQRPTVIASAASLGVQGCSPRYQCSRLVAEHPSQMQLGECRTSLLHSLWVAAVQLGGDEAQIFAHA